MKKKPYLCIKVIAHYNPKGLWALRGWKEWGSLPPPKIASATMFHFVKLIQLWQRLEAILNAAM